MAEAAVPSERSQRSTHGVGTIRSERNSARNIFLNVATITAVAFAILTYRLPIFGNYLYSAKGTHAFGDVLIGHVVTTNFVVQNLHPYPVTVLSLHGSCGCTRAFGRRTPFRLLPLEATTVTASLDTTGRTGLVKQSVSVVTSDNRSGTPLSMSCYAVAKLSSERTIR